MRKVCFYHSYAVQPSHIRSSSSHPAFPFSKSPARNTWPEYQTHEVDSPLEGTYTTSSCSSPSFLLTNRHCVVFLADSLQSRRAPPRFLVIALLPLFPFVSFCTCDLSTQARMTRGTRPSGLDAKERPPSTLSAHCGQHEKWICRTTRGEGGGERSEGSERLRGRGSSHGVGARGIRSRSKSDSGNLDAGS